MAWGFNPPLSHHKYNKGLGENLIPFCVLSGLVDFYNGLS